MKKNKFLVVIYVFTFLFVIVGTTFAYFSSTVVASGNSSVVAANIGINLLAYPLYADNAIIPTNNSDIMTAYEHECVDNLGNGACYAYTVTVENTGIAENYVGTINFNLNGITNLNYLVLDEDDNEYKEITNIVSGTDQSLGESFYLDEDGSKTFKIIVWLPNLTVDQNDTDSAGNFTASVTYSSASIDGSKVTAVFAK